MGLANSLIIHYELLSSPEHIEGSLRVFTQERPVRILPRRLKNVDLSLMMGGGSGPVAKWLLLEQEVNSSNRCIIWPKIYCKCIKNIE